MSDDNHWTIKELLDELDGNGLTIVDEDLISEVLSWFDLKLEDEIEIQKYNSHTGRR